MQDYLGDGSAGTVSPRGVAGGRLRCGGEEAAVLEQPRDPGGHVCLFYLGEGVEGGREAARRKSAIRVASGLYIRWLGAPRRRKYGTGRVGVFLRLQNSCQPRID